MLKAHDFIWMVHVKERKLKHCVGMLDFWSFCGVCMVNGAEIQPCLCNTNNTLAKTKRIYNVSTILIVVLKPESTNFTSEVFNLVKHNQLYKYT